MTKQSKVELTAFIMLAGFVAAVIYNYIMGLYLGYRWPANTFLYNPDHPFADFTSPVIELAKGPYVGFMYAWPPPAKVIFYICRFLPPWFYLTVVLGGLLFYYGKKVLQYVADAGSPAYRATLLLIFTLCSYPLLLTVDRANNEIFVFLLLFFAAERLAAKKLSAFSAIGLAAAVKIFPVTCLPLAYAHGGWKGLARAAGYLAAATAAGFLILALAYGMTPLAVLHAMREVMTNYNNVYVFVKGWIIFNHSLFDLFKVCAIVTCVLLGRDVPDAAFFTASAGPYFILTALLAAGMTLYMVLREKTLWKQITLCVIMMDLLPYASADYKILNLFIPFCLFVNEKPGRYDLAYTLIFALMMIPKNYAIVHTLMLSIVVSPLLLIALAVLIMKEGLQPDGETRNSSHLSV
jgi:hypothetical protein